MKRTRSEIKRELKELKRLRGVGGQVHPETQKTVSAILLFGAAALLLLARFSLAGPAGNFLFSGLDKLFGWGYYLLPAVAFLVAVLFLFTLEKKFFGLTFLGAALFIFFGLGIIDVVSAGNGGLIGAFVGLLEIPFGKIASLVLLGTLATGAFLIAFNISFRLRPREADEKAKERSPKIKDIVVKSAEPPQEKPIEKEVKEKKAEEERTEQTLVEPVIAAPAVATMKPLRKPVMAESKNYVPPPASLLHSSVEKPTSGDLRANANIIKRTLESFGIAVEMGEISIGPKVTRYTLKPAEGVKISRITALNQDLALALAAHPIRIEAPIPGKSLVGIEVPNKAAAIVRLGSMMAYPDFGNSGSLGFPLGRDVSGEPIFVDIERMPHMLVAGATGSGKSICIHSILISLLYKNSPEALKMILIDPKRVELSIYDGSPHLVAPVITEAKKTVGVFRWAIQEMEKRYETLLQAGSRDIKSYNKNGHGTMPYLLIVIDELADLMASYGREIEGSIVRLAQMARATGIHLIVSTQRPSVEVLTGLIKANITARVALQVASQVDSRTILDMAGAEKLLGGGDMLFMSSEFSKPKRIQGAYISEEEIKKVADFIREHNDFLPATDTAIEKLSGDVNGENGNIFDDYTEDGGEDELIKEAINVIKEAKKASASLLQRRLRVGYARAARLLDIMEEKGIIGPGDGAKPREILIE